MAAGLVERPEDWPGVCWLPEDVGRTLTAKRPEILFSTAVLDDDVPDDEALREARERLQRQRERWSQQDTKRGRSRGRRKQLAKERDRRHQQAATSAPLPGAPKPRSSLPETVSYTVPVPKCLRGWEIEDVRAYLRAALDLYVHEIHERRAAEGKGFLGVEALLDQDPHTPPPETKIDTDSPATYQRRPYLATKGLDKGTVRQLKDDLAQWHQDYEEAVDLLLRSPTPHRARFPLGAHLRAQEQRRIRAAYRAQAPPRAA